MNVQCSIQKKNLMHPKRKDFNKRVFPLIKGKMINITFIKSSELTPLMYDRLYALSQSCGMHFSLLENRSPYVDEFVAVATTNVLEDVVAMMLIRVYHNLQLIELYNVCVDSSYRGKGIASKLLKSLQQYILYSKVWLGVDLSNPLYSQVVSVYAKNGFMTRNIANKSPSGSIFNYEFVEMIYDSLSSSNTSSINKSIKRAEKLKKTYDKSMSKCSSVVNVEAIVLEYIKGYLVEVEEYGGILSLEDDSLLKIQESSITKGEYGKVVIPSGGRFTFHTHPDICYAREGCYIGWPSGGDMANAMLNVTRGELATFVVTREGVYSVQCTIQFQMFLESLKEQNEIECLDGIYALIKERFSTSESLRSSITVPPNMWEKEFQGYLNKVNVITLEMMVESIENEKERIWRRVQECVEKSIIADDFVLYNVNFWSWETITSKGGISFAVETINETCPLSSG